MGCGCNKGNGLQYKVTKNDGTTVTVKTLTEAQQIVARVGGSFVAVTV